MLDLNYEPSIFVPNIDLLSEDEWLAERRKGIGGSDAGIVMGVSPFKTPRELWHDKKGLLQKSEEDVETWLKFKFGHENEKLIAALFEQVTGYRVFSIRSMFQHPKYPFMLADVDFFVEMPDGRIFILECKTCDPETLQKKWGSPDDDKVPEPYQWQCVHYMATTNIDGVFIVCLAAGGMKYYRQRFISRDLAKEETLIREEEKFWYQVQNDIKPPFNMPNTKREKEFLNRMYPVSSEEIVLDDELAGNVSQYLTMQVEKTRLENEAKELKARMDGLMLPVLESLKGAQGKIVVDGTRYELKQKVTTRRGIFGDNLKRLKEDHPEIYAGYLGVSESRSFDVSPYTYNMKGL